MKRKRHLRARSRKKPLFIFDAPGQKLNLQADSVHRSGDDNADRQSTRLPLHDDERVGPQTVSYFVPQHDAHTPAVPTSREMRKTMEVQQAIKEVEALYRAITGTDLPNIPGPVHPIPPERDPEQYVQDRLNELLEAARRLTGRASPVLGYATWMPRIDALETADEWRIDMEVPRVLAKDLSVVLRDGYLVVRGRRLDHEGIHLRWSEIPRGAFVRTLPIPSGVDGGRVTAKLLAGILTIRLPKGQAGTTGERTITVETAAA